MLFWIVKSTFQGQVFCERPLGDGITKVLARFYTLGKNGTNRIVPEGKLDQLNNLTYQIIKVFYICAYIENTCILYWKLILITEIFIPNCLQKKLLPYNSFGHFTVSAERQIQILIRQCQHHRDLAADVLKTYILMFFFWKYHYMLFPNITYSTFL